MKSTHQGVPPGTIMDSAVSLKTLGAVVAERWRKAKGLPVQLGLPTFWFCDGSPA
jgi:hypothetical protein